MKTYVYRLNDEDGLGFYVYITDDRGELFDIAGPFDDELDAECARIRIEEVAS